MKKIKVMTVVGTRPEIIRLSSVIHKLNNSKAIEHILVHTGQNYDYELNEIFFQDFNLPKPQYYLKAVGRSQIETIGNILIEIDRVLEKEQVDAFLILGDTNSCLSALAAKKRKIPIFHMEAGNRSFDQRVPEETNRKIVDHLADINMPYSDIARTYLLNEGISADRIIKTGSPMFEVINSKLEDIKNSSILEELHLNKGKYFVVSAHREENVDTLNLFDLINTLNEIANLYQMPIIFSTHPRTKKQLDRHNIKLNPLIKIIKPLGFTDYNQLQMNSFVVLSDSGTISEEASILNFKALNIRQAHERPEAMEETQVMMVGLKKERILQALEVLENQTTKTLNPVKDYLVANVSDKVLRIILSYTNYVNENVWKKHLDVD